MLFFNKMNVSDSIDKVLDKTNNLELLAERIRESQDKMVAMQGNIDITLGDILEGLENQKNQKSFEQDLIEELKNENDGLVKLIIQFIELAYHSVSRQTDMADDAGRNNLPDQHQYSEIADESGSKNLLDQFREMADGIGLRLIASEGADIDYERHQVEAIVASPENKYSGTIARIHTPGFEYKGKVIKKAVVSVYK